LTTAHAVPSPSSFIENSLSQAGESSEAIDRGELKEVLLVKLNFKDVQSGPLK
jgi:hypothetical protein